MLHIKFVLLKMQSFPTPLKRTAEPSNDVRPKPWFLISSNPENVNKAIGRECIMHNSSLLPSKSSRSASPQGAPSALCLVVV